MKNKFNKGYINTFITGLSAILPITVTLFVFYKGFIFVDGLTSNFIKAIFGFRIIGLGFLTTVLIVFAFGVFVKQYLGNKIFEVFEKTILKIPYAQIIYQAVKEISNSFLRKDKVAFKKPVLVDFPSKGTKSIGFISNDEINISGENRIVVFVPTTPNPTSGFMILCKEEDIEYLDMTVNEATKMIISLGVISPEKFKKTI